MRKGKKLLRGSLVIIGAIGVSALGLFASDSLQGIDRDLVGLSNNAIQICPPGTTHIENGDASFCADVYEASTGSDCPIENPKNIVETTQNISNASCVVASRADAKPWRFVSLTQAQTLCANAGKRLPTSDEWYRLALGTRSEDCVLESSGGPQNTGSGACLSANNIHDAVGNVWEWVDETVTDRSFAGRILPESGYVASADASGIAITTDESEQIVFDLDYFWSKESGTFGMIRGGFYGSESDGGVYTTNVSVETSFASPGVGFRCIKDL